MHATTSGDLMREAGLCAGANDIEEHSASTIMTPDERRNQT
jgi:hypothetical protein